MENEQKPKVELLDHNGNKVININNQVWMPKAEYDKYQEWRKQAEDDCLKWLLWGIKPERWNRTPEQIIEDRVKLAYVTIDGKRQTIGVDNLLGNGYEMEETMPTFKRPLVKLTKPFVFERWCRMMDI